ncbi:MAG TPA: prepilin-type N-terminal cleavage/methylation domain-containing protein [Candidatus Paceibacterota bacterium]|nr:prepilin-type N-terminal cleavage/methylation domain-containing protein [Candidatus Paceibacterota bacterium]
MQSLFVKQERQHEGFTLLELLIVIAIIAILSVMLIIVINPVETLRKSRDSQRISDLNTLKTAMGVYTTTIASPNLDGSGTSTINALCRTSSAWVSGNKVWYSLPSDSGSITGVTVAGAAVQPTAAQVTQANLSRVDGGGWIPVNFEALTSGSPISNLPVDPVNKITTLTAPTSTDFVYRYACNSTNLTYEVDARLESDEFTKVTNRMQSDGGDNDNLFEVGTNIRILGTGGF